MSDTQVLQLSIAKSRLNKQALITDGPLPHQYSRSSTKRIYQSVFRIIDFDDHHQNEDFNADSSDENTNAGKIIQMLGDDNTLIHLYQKMKMEGNLDHYPILRVHCEQLSQSTCIINENIMLNYQSLYQLEYNDLSHIFGRFGDLNKIILSQDMKFAYIFYSTFHAAYIASKLLNGLQFMGKMAKLAVTWADHTDYDYLLPNLAVYLNSINWQLMYKFCSTPLNSTFRQDDNSNSNNTNSNNSQKQNKLTCRYDIQIQNERDFQVARRIIGSKGYNMKRIIEESIELAKGTPYYRNNPKSLQNSNQLLKLRLRGKGSGYKQGPQQQQSQQSLHLCVSAKDQICYQIACQKVQKLLQGVYQQYFQYTQHQFGRGIQLQISKNSIVSLSNNQENVMGNCQQQGIGSQQEMYYGQQQQSRGYYTQEELNSLRITPQKICELLEMRNKARRELNFIQADRIRNFLRNCGVCLIDEKGRRGRAMDVTTWKYVF